MVTVHRIPLPLEIFTLERAAGILLGPLVLGVVLVAPFVDAAPEALEEAVEGRLLLPH